MKKSTPKTRPQPKMTPGYMIAGVGPGTKTPPKSKRKGK